MRKLLAAAVAVFLLVGCTDETGARHALRSAGLHPTEVGGYGWFGCDSKSDFFSTKFTAMNPEGELVSGVVCSGFFKGKTIRFY